MILGAQSTDIAYNDRNSAAGQKSGGHDPNNENSYTSYFDGNEKFRNQTCNKTSKH